MKLCQWGKDGGPDSKVWGFWFIELKSLFSIVLLRFDYGSREAYHSHAFHSLSWLLRGMLTEFRLNGSVTPYTPSLYPIVTKRSTFHNVNSIGRSWVLSFRGPWAKTWQEFLPANQSFVTLASGRKVVNDAPVN